VGEKSKIAYQTGQKLTLFPDGRGFLIHSVTRHHVN
jgi:hypothetical protein